MILQSLFGVRSNSDIKFVSFVSNHVDPTHLIIILLLDFARNTRHQKTPAGAEVCCRSGVACHERVCLAANESSGDGRNRTAVQQVHLNRSTGVASLMF